MNSRKGAREESRSLMMYSLIAVVPPSTTVPVVQQKINPSIKLCKKYSNHSSQLCRIHDHLIPHLQLSLMTSVPSWLALNSNNLRRHHNSRPKILTVLMLAKSSTLETTIQYISLPRTRI